LLFVFVSPVSAVVKTSGFLEVTMDEPIFPSSIIWYPGLEETRSFIVRNKSGETKTVLIDATNESETNEMSKEYLFKVSENGTILYGDSWSKTLKNFWDVGELNLGSVGSWEKKTYDIGVLLPTSVGNDFQGKSANFDLKIGFEGTDDETSFSGSSCSDSKPTSAPSSLTAVAGTNNVTLSWNKAGDPVTYYLVTYGESSGAQTYGNPNVGGSATTSYVVGGLSGGKTYYFKVRAGNGCTPGDYSNEASATPTGVFIAVPAEGFTQGVLGTTENINSGISTQSSPLVKVLGAQAPWWQKYWWLVPLLFIGGLLLWWILGKIRGNENH
jgi:hypothetical protein